MSGNPFRRSQPPAHSPSAFDADAAEADATVSTSGNDSPPQSSSQPHPSRRPGDGLVRRVSASHHAGSPPPSLSDSSSDRDDGGSADPFGKDAASEGGSVDDSDEVNQNTTTNAGPMQAITSPAVVRPPPNPFQRTLATMDSGEKHVSFQEEPPAIIGEDPPERKKEGYTAQDVDSFKRLLMTGSKQSESPSHHAESLEPTLPPTQEFPASPPRPPAPASSDSSRSLDYTVASPPNDRGSGNSAEKRKPPPPPTRRHGRPMPTPEQQRKPQTVSFDDFTASFRPSDPATPTQPSPHTSNDQSTPQSRPLEASQSASNTSVHSPPAVSDAALRSPSPSPSFEVPQSGLDETASKELSSTNNDAKRRAPPAVPIARRASKRTAPSNPNSNSSAWNANASSNTSIRSRSNSALTASSSVTGGEAPSDNGIGSQNSKPPPPPSRRTGAGAATVPPGPSPPATAGDAHTPPPTGPRTHRASSASSSIRNGAAPAPPAPPPRRNVRKSSTDSGAPGSGAVGTPEEAASINAGDAISEDTGTKAAGADILADMTAFQEEIDALRQRYDSGNGA